MQMVADDVPIVVVYLLDCLCKSICMDKGDFSRPKKQFLVGGSDFSVERRNTGNLAHFTVYKYGCSDLFTFTM